MRRFSMANIQKQFLDFHGKIKVDPDELREKRDILLEKIKKSLKEKDRPIPELINQGSYIYGVGIKPVSEDLEYDIDVGLAFPIKSQDYSAKEVKDWVYEAVKGHTNSVKDKGPCIRVRYAKGFHVDLVCYAKYKSDESKEEYQLAHKDNTWKPSEPKKLKQYVNDAREKFSDTKLNNGSDQLQRVVRYLKRWNDVAITEESDDKPIGLAMLLFVIDKLDSPKYDSRGEMSDLEALISVSYAAKICLGRITTYKPTPEYEDVFGKLSEGAMHAFKERFSDLYNALVKAKNESDSSKACDFMRKYFGDDFPTCQVNKSLEGISEEKRTVLLSAFIADKDKSKNHSKPWSDWR
jgi:hypothetical protein